MSNQIFHYSNTGISSGQRFYLKDDVSGIFVRNLKIDSNFPILASNLIYNTGNQTISGIKTFTSRPTVNGTGVLLSGEAAGLPNTVVYTTGNQNISGTKNFYTRPTVNGTGVLLSGEAAGLPNTVVYTTGNQLISGSKTFASRPTVNGTGVLLSGEGVASLVTIQDEGSSQGSASTLNFVGAGVSASVGGSTATITINGGGGGISFVSPPVTPNSAGTSGQMALDQNYAYYCISNNNWRRSAISSW